MHVLLQLGLTEPLGIALAALPALLNVGLLVYSLRNLPSDRVTRTFAFFLAMLVAWQLFDLSVRSATTAEAAASWRGCSRSTASAGARCCADGGAK